MGELNKQTERNILSVLSRDTEWKRWVLIGGQLSLRRSHEIEVLHRACISDLFNVRRILRGEPAWRWSLINKFAKQKEENLKGKGQEFTMMASPLLDTSHHSGVPMPPHQPDIEARRQVIREAILDETFQEQSGRIARDDYTQRRAAKELLDPESEWAKFRLEPYMLAFSDYPRCALNGEHDLPIPSKKHTM